MPFTRSAPMRLLTSLVVAIVVCCVPVSDAAAQTTSSAPTIVILVRHAEKGAEPTNDPPLTTRGTERAAALSEALREAKVAAVYHTPTIRTRETARPVAARFGLTPQLIPLVPRAAQSDSIRAIVRRHPGQTIVLVGHPDPASGWSRPCDWARMWQWLGDRCRRSSSGRIVRWPSERRCYQH